MKKWITAHRDNCPPPLSSPLDSFAGSSRQSSPRTLWTTTAGDDFLDDDSHLDADRSQHVDLAPVSRLLTGDIDALLEEDERNRPAQDDITSTSALGSINLEFPFGVQGIASPPSSLAHVGLPAPPRGPRKPAPRRSRSRQRRQTRPSQTSLPSSLDSGVLNATRPSFLMSTSSPSPRSFLEETRFEPDVPLGIEVINALNANQARDDEVSLLSSSPSSKLSPPSQNRDTMDSGHTFGKMLAASSIADFKTARSSTLLSNDEFSDTHKADKSVTSSPPKYTPSVMSYSSTDRRLSPAAKANLPQLTIHQPIRPLLAHAHSHSRDSDFSRSSFSSHDPPSTAHEPRISISSTIYPPSGCESLPPPPPVPHLTSDYRQGRPSTSTYGDSLMSDHHHQHERDGCNLPADLAVPSSAVSETLSPPLFASPDELSSPELQSSPSDFPFPFVPRRRPRVHLLEEIALRAPRPVKPPLPSAPKPIFGRSRSAQPESRISDSSLQFQKEPSPSPSPKPSLFSHTLRRSFIAQQRQPSGEQLPPTTNMLNAQERADLIRKSRKLTQMLGETPSPVTGPDDPDSPIQQNCLLPIIPNRKAHMRGALSVSDAMQLANVVKHAQTQRSRLVVPTGEKQSHAPLSPMTFRSSTYVEDEDDHEDSEGSTSPFETPSLQSPRSLKDRLGESVVRSPVVIDPTDSFMDLAENNSKLESTPSIYTLEDSVAELQFADEEKRRKRERLNKLHRFLGSKIPAELVLGPQIDVMPLPPMAPQPDGSDSGVTSDGEGATTGRVWLKGRRRASVAEAVPSKSWTDIERLQENLNDKQRTLKVKRAVKMEKMFGEQPPSDLLHKVQTGSPMRMSPKLKEHAASAPSSPVVRNINKSAYRKPKSKKDDRPGTAESSKGLLANQERLGMSSDMTSQDHQHFVPPMSATYLSYRHSLVSLTNIVNNDDRESLADLHEYLNGRSSRASSRRDVNLEPSYLSLSKRPSLKSERRHSLPLRPSLTSLASHYTMSEPRVEVSPFEIRRRRAAKLSNFFGVSYRNLFGEVLESLEIGVREDEGKGTLTHDEVEDLMNTLRNLKQRRDEFS